MRQYRRPIVGLLAVALAGCGESGFSNCVQVEKTSDFTGEWLAAEHPLEKRTVRTEQCVALDQTQDRGNGPKRGTVRWAECLLVRIAVKRVSSNNSSKPTPLRGAA